MMRQRMRDRFHQEASQANRPFFVWMNCTRMHVFTHVRQSMRGQSACRT